MDKKYATSEASNKSSIVRINSEYNIKALEDNEGDEHTMPVSTVNG